MSQLTGSSRLPGMSSAAGHRPVVGMAVATIALLHLALTPVFYPKSTRSILDGGVVASVEKVPELVETRGVGFWYATSGWAFLLLAWSIGAEERRTGVPTRAQIVGLAGLSAWGTVFMPVSGFLTLGAVAGYAALRRRRRADLPLWQRWVPAA